MIAPSAIVFVNNDLTTNVEDMLVRQLYINEVVDGYVFDARVAADSNYLTYVKSGNLRLMVVRSFEEITNRELADVAIFVKAGLAAVEINKWGPHGITFPVVNLSWPKLGIIT